MPYCFKVTVDYTNDPRSSRTVLREFRAGFEDEDDEATLATVHYRGGPDEFALALEYINSDDPLDRATGAHALGHLGFPNGGTYIDESVDVLSSMLTDPSTEGIVAALVALGARGTERIVEPKSALRKHPDIRVRLAVADLGASNSPLAVETMLELALDSALEVRDRALFELGSIMEIDTPAIREALALGLAEHDDEARGEAMLGLARRNDPRAFVAISTEWDRESIGKLSLEAAHQLGDPRHIGSLEELAKEWGPGPFLDHVNAAIASCQAGPIVSRFYRSEELDLRIRVDRSANTPHVFLVEGEEESQLDLDDERYWRTLNTGYPEDNR